MAVRPRATGQAAATTKQQQLLDSFWEARGVLDPAQRKRLVDAADQLDSGEPGSSSLDSAPLAADVPLPGLTASWQLETSAPEVLAASRRLLALQRLLGGGGGGGGGDVDVVWMVVREPGLLSADLSELTGRLVDMKLATYGMDVNVLKVVEAQPALLINDRWRLGLEALQASHRSAADGSGAPSSAARPEPSPSPAGPSPTAAAGGRSAAAADPALPAGAAGSASASGSGSASTSGRPQGAPTPDASTAAGAGADGGAAAAGVRQLVDAWQYGVSSDGDAEWAARLSQLSAYRAAHGDACCGFRDGDDPELSRWATKQRADHRRGQLEQGRLDALAALGFHFDAEEAEWCRWFAQLLSFRAEAGHASPMPLVTGADMYLINWCSVQRIARRSRVLCESRVQRLQEAGFDWTGADPLS